MKKVTIFLTAVIVVAFSLQSAQAFGRRENALQSSTVKSVSFYLWAMGVDKKGQNQAQNTQNKTSANNKLAQLPEELNVPLNRFFARQQN